MRSSALSETVRRSSAGLIGRNGKVDTEIVVIDITEAGGANGIHGILEDHRTALT